MRLETEEEKVAIRAWAIKNSFSRQRKQMFSEHVFVWSFACAPLDRQNGTPLLWPPSKEDNDHTKNRNDANILTLTHNLPVNQRTRKGLNDSSLWCHLNSKFLFALTRARLQKQSGNCKFMHDALLWEVPSPYLPHCGDIFAFHKANSLSVRCPNGPRVRVGRRMQQKH